MPAPSLVIAGTHSGVGKTTLTLALLAAFRRRGLRVQPFKVGPDFIDPMLHARAAGRPSHTLDGWMLAPEQNRRVFARAARDADVSVVEGVMGLYDGRDATSDAGSTAEMAKLLDLPVLLVVDAGAMARSAAALVRGFELFDESLDLAGVVFNRVAGEGHYAFLRDAVASSCRARVLGWLADADAVRLPERHLGLVSDAAALDEPRLEALVAWVERTLDLDALLALARDASASPADAEPPVAAPSVRVGIARDEAFCFYYQENLERLAASGAELVEFSPVADRALPEGLGGIYLGGGYPELHAARLSANEPMRRAVAAFRGPVYAECGGFMYLTEAIVDLEGAAHPMVGRFPTRSHMRGRIAAIAYREVEGTGAGWLAEGERARGHEFRYSEIDEMPADVAGTYRGAPGYALGLATGSYVHLHFGSCPSFAARFVEACRTFRTSVAAGDGGRPAGAREAR